jgi:hypothetical protein
MENMDWSTLFFPMNFHNPSLMHANNLTARQPDGAFCRMAPPTISAAAEHEAEPT